MEITVHEQSRKQLKKKRPCLSRIAIFLLVLVGIVLIGLVGILWASGVFSGARKVATKSYATGGDNSLTHQPPSVHVVAAPTSDVNILVLSPFLFRCHFSQE